jgi:hypothetical protein
MTFVLAHSGDFHWYTAVIYLGPLLGVLAWLGLGSLRDRRRERENGVTE